jgi:hypothetical protein
VVFLLYKGRHPSPGGKDLNIKLITMQILLLILFGTWAVGALIIGNKHSQETILSIFKLQSPRTTFKGWVYLILWGIVMFFIIGLVGMAAGRVLRSLKLKFINSYGESKSNYRAYFLLSIVRMFGA